MDKNVRLNLDEINVLEACAKTEEAFADLYRYFSNIYSDNPQASKLWGITSIEEDNHAEQFRFAFRLMGSGIQALKIDLDKVNTIFTKVQAICDKVQKSPPSLIEALRLAINLENSLSNFHMDSIAIFENENLAKLFTSMLKNDQEHIKSLEKAYEKLLQC